MQINVKDAVVMKTLNPEQAGEVFAVIDRDRAYLRKWLPWVDSTDQPSTVADVIRRWEQEREAGTDYVFGIFKDGRYIGNIGLHDIKKANKSGMIGYWLAEGEQGAGIMTDCVRQMVYYGFADLSLNRIYIHCADSNAKSRAIPQRLGFELEGVLRDGECLYGEYFDMAVYGMLRKNWKDEKAVELFLKGYNCAQSVVGAFCEEAGLDLNTALKLANGFGGGVRCGELCGAVSGALMALGLKCGFYIERDFKQKGYCNMKTYEFVEKFKAANGSVLCRDLLGINVRSPEDFTTPAAQEAHKTICPKMVASAVRILENMNFEVI